VNGLWDEQQRVWVVDMASAGEWVSQVWVVLVCRGVELAGVLYTAVCCCFSSFSVPSIRVVQSAMA